MNDKQKDLIRGVFLRNGFTIKAGQDDLADYVYEAAQELIASTVQASNQSVSQILKEIECNIEPTVRDLINGQSGINDIYDYLARIKIMLSQLYITQSDQQPVAWLEGNLSMTGMIPSYMDLCTQSVMIHTIGKPKTFNPVWPLYAHPSNAPDVSALVSALGEMIDLAERVDEWASFSTPYLGRAQEALFKFHQKGINP